MSRYFGVHRPERTRLSRNLIAATVTAGAALVIVFSALWGAGALTASPQKPTSLQQEVPNPIAATTNPAPLGISCPPGQAIVNWPGTIDGQAGSWSCMDWPTATPTPSPSTSTTTPVPTTTPPPTTTSPVPTTTSVTTIKAYITGYSYFDNTPPGSADISNPVLHQTAGGTGTYADPITVAVGHSISNGTDTLDWPAGTRFYIPNLHRYFIVEDTCGDGGKPQNGPCHKGYPSGASTWLDVWVGGKGGTSNGADNCMDAITRVSTVVVNPPAGYPVTSGDIYSAAGCTAQYGDSIPV
jgi:hypothetical protein